MEQMWWRETDSAGLLGSVCSAAGQLAWQLPHVKMGPGSVKAVCDPVKADRSRLVAARGPLQDSRLWSLTGLCSPAC